MLSKEEYISLVASGNMQYIPRLKNKDLLSIEDKFLTQRLKPVSQGKVREYYKIVNDEKVRVHHFSGIKSMANTIVNSYENYIEVVRYKNDFEYIRGRHEDMYNAQGEKVLRENPRLFMMQDGDLIPRRSINWDKVGHSNMKSLQRSKDNFFGYVQSRRNNWRYFVTFTFSPKRVDRMDDEAVKNAYGIFSKALKRIDKNVTIIVVPERHPNSGAIHFHGFIGNIDLTRYLSLARGNNNQPLRSKCGQLLYNLSLFKYGYSTVAILDKDYNEQQIANYCAKYLTKSDRIGYNKKAYYRTTNLYFKDKVTTYFTDGAFNDLINSIGFDCEFKKVTDKVTVYRIKKQKSPA